MERDTTNLDDSWKQCPEYMDINWANSLSFDEIYTLGASDFQTRALEELTVLRTLHAGTEYWDSYNKAIEIIKNLKA